MKNIRWIQRFDNFEKAFKTLRDAIALSRIRDLTALEKHGLIHSFEFSHELAWNVLKDYLAVKGISDLIGSKDASRSAFKNGLIENGEVWMKMFEARNFTSHTYQQEIA